MLRQMFVVIAIAIAIGLFAGIANAQNYDVAASLDGIRAARQAEMINADEEALLMTYALFDAAKLPERFFQTKTDIRELAGMGTDWFHGTTAVMALRERLDKVSPAVREQIESYFLKGNPGLKMGDPSDKSRYPDDIDLPNVYYTDHFAIQWGNSYSADMDRIEEWGDILENEVWATEIEEWGYQDITNSNTYYISVYIGNSGSGAPEIGFAGAYTTIYNSYNSMLYMVFYPDILYSVSSLRDVSSHEFYHCTQFTHALTDECWYYMGEDNTWFVEATAVWAESTVYPDINNYIYYIYDWAERPYMPLTDNSYSTAAPYARGIWGRYLYEHIDGLDTIYEIWNSCFFNGLLYANNEYLLGQSMTWEDTYLDFMAKVVTLDFEDGALMPDFDMQARVTSYPYILDAPANTSTPRINSLNFFELTPGGIEAEVNIRFTGEDSNIVNWVAGVLKFKSKGGTELERLELNNHGQGDNTVDGLGTTYSKMVLLISPTSGTRTDSSSKFTYSLQITRGDDQFPDDDDDDNVDDDDNADDDNDDISDDDNSSEECLALCQALDNCGLVDEFGVDNLDDCLSLCGDIKSEILEDALDSNSCDDLSGTLFGDSGDDDDDDDSGCGC